MSLEASCRLSGSSFTTSSYSSWDLHLVQSIASSISREALHGVPFSLLSPCWSLSVCAFLGLRRSINADDFNEIALGYSIISPVINGLACATFFLFYQLYKYLFLYVYQQPTTDTGGLFYPKALQHIFVGLYVQQVCLCALFFLARNGADKASAVPQGALMVVLIVITVSFLCSLPTLRFIEFIYL